ncbi:CBS domain-containing protein [Streptomyces sp. AA8]|nr:CBS domain-containing protein [Streptomyces telluris]
MVQDDGVIGVITDRDLVVRAMAHGLSPALRVEEVMSGDPVTVEPDTPVAAALHAMRSIKARHLPVVDGGGDSWAWSPSTICSRTCPSSWGHWPRWSTRSARHRAPSAPGDHHSQGFSSIGASRLRIGRRRPRAAAPQGAERPGRHGGSPLPDGL